MLGRRACRRGRGASPFEVGRRYRAGATDQRPARVCVASVAPRRARPRRAPAKVRLGRRAPAKIQANMYLSRHRRASFERRACVLRFSCAPRERLCRFLIFSRRAPCETRDSLRFQKSPRALAFQKRGKERRCEACARLARAMREATSCAGLLALSSSAGKEVESSALAQVSY